MAEIKLVAMEVYRGGPELPKRHRARASKRVWPGGGTTATLVLDIADSQIEVWPAPAEIVRDLGEQLIRVAAELAKEEAERQRPAQAD